MSVLKPPVEPLLKHGCRCVCSAESKGVDGWLGGRAGQHRAPFPAGREPCFSRPESAPGPGPLVTLHLPLGTGRQRSEHSLDSCYMAFLQTQEGDRQCSGSHAGPKGTVSTLPDWAPHPRRVTRPSSTTPCRPEGFLGLSAGCPAPASMLSAKLTRPSARGGLHPICRFPSPGSTEGQWRWKPCTEAVGCDADARGRPPPPHAVHFPG